MGGYGRLVIAASGPASTSLKKGILSLQLVPHFVRKPMRSVKLPTIRKFLSRYLLYPIEGEAGKTEIL